MKNKLITLYLTSLVMFTLSGILLIEDNYSKNSNKVQYLDFTNDPVYIYPKGKK